MIALPALLRRTLLEPLLDLAFPPICPACGSFLWGDRQGLCSDCRALLAAATLGRDALCALRMSLRDSGALDDVLVLSYFDRHSPLQVLIHRLKYQGARSVGPELGARLGRLLERELPIAEFTGIIPVPLHAARRRERGYNQARLVAEGVQSVVAIPILDDVLLRRRSTPSQTGLTAAARHHNVAGAFNVGDHGKERLSGRAFLIVDDVLTTGATLEACARALKAAGASRCAGAAVALAR